MTAIPELLKRRIDGTYEVDEWGYDPDLVCLLDPVFRARWDVVVDGAERIPSTGAAVLVANRRVGLSEPVALVRGVRLATGRRVRFLGAPDLPALGPALRRLGGALDRPEELTGLLRAGHLTAVPLTPVLTRRRRAGTLTPATLAPALSAAVPVFPVALVGAEWRRRWRVVVGPPIEVPDDHGPLAIAELAETAAAAVQALLDEAFPPRWLWG